MYMLNTLGRLAMHMTVIGALAGSPVLQGVAQPGAFPRDGAGLLPVQRSRLSLQQAIEIATERVNGRVVRADTVMLDGRAVHEILIIRDDGLVRTVHVDAETGDVL